MIFRKDEERTETQTVFIDYHLLRERHGSRLICRRRVNVNLQEVNKGVKVDDEIMCDHRLNPYDGSERLYHRSRHFL